MMGCDNVDASAPDEAATPPGTDSQRISNGGNLLLYGRRPSVQFQQSEQQTPSEKKSEGVIAAIQNATDVDMACTAQSANARVSCHLRRFTSTFHQHLPLIQEDLLDEYSAAAFQDPSTCVPRWQQVAQLIVSAPVRFQLQNGSVSGLLQFTKDFELVVILLIFINCASMAAYRPMDGDDSQLNRFLANMEAWATVLFTVEVVLELAAAGSLQKYFRNYWNLFDFILVAAGYTRFLPFSNSTSAFKGKHKSAANKSKSHVQALRTLRALRPLRTINRLQNLRAIVVAFIDALPMLGSVVLLTVLALSLWALMSMQMFIGWTCVELEDSLAYNVPGVDNFAKATLSMFQCVTLSAWSYMQYRSMDNQGWWASFLYILLVLFVALIMMNLFTAVLKLRLAKAMSTLGAEIDSNGDDAHVRRNCMARLYHWLRAHVLRYDSDSSHGSDRSLHSQSRNPPISDQAISWQQRLHSWVESQYMANLFLLAIIVNSILLAMESADMSPERAHSLELANVFFTWLFAVEFVLRLLALGVQGYFASLANSFDAAVVIISMVELLALGSKSSVSALRSLKTFRVLKSFRVLRVLRAFKYLRALSIIAEVLGDSVPAFSAIGMLIFLFLMVFAIIGVHVYGTAQLDIGFPNFHTFFGSLVIVFQVMTTEDWQALMMSTVRSGEPTSYVFFLSWIILSKYVFLMLFLAVAMEGFERSYSAMDHEGPGINAVVSTKSSRTSLYQEDTQDTLSADGKQKSADSGFGDEEGLLAFESTHNKAQLCSKCSMEAIRTAESEPDGATGACHDSAIQRILLTEALPDDCAPPIDDLCSEAAKLHHTNSTGQKVDSGTQYSFSHDRSQPMVVLNITMSDSRGKQNASEDMQHASGVHDVSADTTQPPLSNHRDHMVCSRPSTDHKIQGSLRSRTGQGEDYAEQSWVPEFGALHKTQRHSEPTRKLDRQECNQYQEPQSHTGVLTLDCHMLGPQQAPESVLLEDSLRERELLHDASTQPQATSQPVAAVECAWEACSTSSADTHFATSGDIAAASKDLETPCTVSTCSEAKDVASYEAHDSFGEMPLQRVACSRYTESSCAHEVTLESCVRPERGANNDSVRRLSICKPVGNDCARFKTGNTDSMRMDPQHPEATLSEWVVSQIYDRNKFATSASMFNVVSQETEVLNLAQKLKCQRRHTLAPGLHSSEHIHQQKVDCFETFPNDLAHRTVEGCAKHHDALDATHNSGKEELDRRNGDVQLCPKDDIKAVQVIFYRLHHSRHSKVRTFPQYGADLEAGMQSLESEHRVLCISSAGSNQKEFTGKDNLDVQARSQNDMQQPQSKHADSAQGKKGSGGLQPPQRAKFRNMVNKIRTVKNLVKQEDPADVVASVARKFLTAMSVESSTISRRDSLWQRIEGMVECGSTLESQVEHADAPRSTSALWASAGELHRKVVELQMSRAMLVLQHPVIAAALAGSAESHAMMTQIIAQAMFAGLDQVVVHEHGKNLFAPPGKLEQMQEDLQLLTLEFSNASAPASDQPSLYIFPLDHPVRKLAHTIGNSHLFQRFSLLLVLMTCVLLAVENPHSQNRRPVFRWLELIAMSFFVFEAAVEIIDLTLVHYLRQWTKVTDLIVIANTMVSLFIDLNGVQAAKILRALRLIRLIRVIARSPSMLNVAQSISLSLKEMSNVLLILQLVITIFAILGVQLFAGKLHFCNDSSATDKASCIGSYTDTTGAEVPRQWSNTKYNFDNLGQALMSLLITLTLDGYLEIMMPCMAIAGDDLQPQVAANPAAFIFFFAYINICVFAIMQLMIGIIFYHYAKVKSTREGKDHLNLQQRQWLTLSALVFQAQPPTLLQEPVNMFRLACFHISTSRWMEPIVTVTVLMNVLIMMASWHPPNPTWIRFQEIVNIVFNMLYLIEVTVKIVAFGPMTFLQPVWNRFDTVLVLLGSVDQMVDLLATSSRALRMMHLRQIFRLLRVLRLLRIFRGSNSLMHLMMVLWSSLEGLWHVGTVVFFVFYVYAYLGVLAFGKVKRGEYLNEHANFESFPSAVLLLFRIATADEWTGIMSDASVTSPECDLVAGNCGTKAAPVYIMSFALLIGQIVLNLFTTIVIETFEEMDEVMKWDVNPDAVNAFSELWSVLDDGSGAITVQQLLWLLRHLPPPLGTQSLVEAKARLRGMVLIRGANDRLPFKLTLFEVMRSMTAAPLPEDLRVVRAHRLKCRIFFANNPIDSSALLRALRDVFAVGHLLERSGDANNLD